MTSALVLLLLPAPVLAQAPEPPRFLAEVHAGALRPQPVLITEAGDVGRSDVRPLAGGRVAWYFGGEGFARRLGLALQIDWAPLGSSEFFDDDVGSFARLEGHWFGVVPALTVDAVRRPRVALEFHAGPAVIGEVTNYLLERIRGGDPFNDEGDWENVCDLRAFEARCREDYRASAAAGLSLRAVVVPKWQLHAGLHYTWFSYGRHVVAGSVGRVW